MSLEIAEKVIDFAYSHTPPDEKIDLGFFGGEPFLEFDLIREITTLIEEHEKFDPSQVRISAVTNGTMFNDDMAQFLNDHNITMGISCDGPPEVQDVFRHYPGGKSSSREVEATITKAVDSLPNVLVNAVYHPRTFKSLPKVVEYFASLGLNQIYLNPDFSADWSQADMESLPEVFDEISNFYIKSYNDQHPLFISLINFKIAVIVRGGYHARERCRMGKGEFAFTPEGNIYPCERLIGDGLDQQHCIGNINTGLKLEKMICHTVQGQEANTECETCSLKDYCMNWCGCSNFMASGFYNRVSPFTCISEKASIEAAFKVFQTLEKAHGPTFYNHLVCHETI